ncbi:MAG TPA: NACHT domain-containing protein [Verrucomicrobiae bacterium]|nr:NACHT domain-containing protein [Verrucomicrobiae bacterium]
MNHFGNILTAMGAESCTSLEISTQWSFWKAEFHTPVETVEGYYLCLKHECPLKEATPANLDKWYKMSVGKGYDLVLTPNSDLAKDLKKSAFEFKAKKAVISKELVSNSLFRNLVFNQVDAEPHFIDPDLESLNNGIIRHNALKSLQKWFVGGWGEKQSNISILVAEGGLGKTTIARHLTNSLQKSGQRIIPLLIESEQWRLRLQSKVELSSIWDIAINNRLQLPGRFLSNRSLFETLVREGLLYIIFDGFDELCLHPQFSEHPSDVINQFIEDLAGNEFGSNARILLTTRENYWNSLKDTLPLNQIDAFRLLGFSNDQRQEYFKVRIKDAGQRDNARILVSQIGNQLYPAIPHAEQNADRLSGTPFILDLVSQVVEVEDPIKFNPYPVDPLDSILTSICRRENKRQTLDIDPLKQMSVFEELFREIDGAITPAQLSEYVQVICDVADSGVLARFQNHFFLRRDLKESLLPRYDVLRTYFIARFLSNGLMDKKTPLFAKSLANVSGNKPHVFDWVTQQLQKHPPQTVREAFAHAAKLLAEPDNQKFRKGAGIALSNLSLRLIQNKDYSKSERSAELCAFLSPDGTNSRQIISAYFSGMFRGYDFSSWTFSHCTFSSVIFRNCLFSASTTFSHCTFEGDVGFESCENENAVVFSKSCNFSKEAELQIAKLRGQPPRADLMRDFAISILEKALRKFRGQYGFQSVKYVNRINGLPRNNPFAHEIWEALISEEIVQRHKIANVTDGGLNINEDPSIRREIMTLFDNDMIGNRLNRVLLKLLAVK